MTMRFPNSQDARDTHARADRQARLDEAEMAREHELDTEVARARVDAAARERDAHVERERTDERRAHAVLVDPRRARQR